MYDPNKDPAKREALIDGILSKMTLDQKVGQCFGCGSQPDVGSWLAR